MDNDLEAFKQGVTTSALPHAENMFKNLQGLMGVDPVESIQKSLDEKLYSKLHANEGILDIFFGDQEESLSNNPYYKAWKKMYLKNPDIAALNKRHKEFLAYYNKIEGNKKDA